MIRRMPTGGFAHIELRHRLGWDMRCLIGERVFGSWWTQGIASPANWIKSVLETLGRRIFDEPIPQSRISDPVMLTEKGPGQI